MATRSTDGRSRRSAKGTSEVEMEHLNSRGEKSEKDEEFDQDDDSEFDEVSDVVEFHPGEEKILVRKLDWRVVGLVALLYLLSFLDRSNIGNARIAGLMVDLKLTNSQFEWLLTAFYITYITFEWMALLFKLIPPHIYLAVVVCSWGIIASLQSLTNSFAQILILRALLGLGEAAFCGVPFYLSFFYRRDELAFRTGLFISAAPLATSCASSIAWLITAVAGYTPIAPWRLLFLIEGFPSVLVAWYCWNNVADSPSEAWFLTKRERILAVRRIRESGAKLDDSHVNEEKGAIGKGKRAIDMREVVQALKDPKSYLTAAMYFSCNVAFSSMPVFLPTIIQQMGYSNVVAQALSTPPYLVSFFVVLAVAWSSDKRGARASYIITFALMASGGYATIVLAGLLGLPSWIRYLSIYPACAGFFTCITLILTWTLNNQESESGKGAGIALLQFLGQCGPLVGTRLFPAGDGPLYVKGMATCATFMAGVAVLAFTLARLLKRENERRWNEAAAGVTDASGGFDVEQPLVANSERKSTGGPFIYIV